MLSGSARIPNRCGSVSAAYLAQAGSRFVPSVTSPPAQTRTGAERSLGFALVALRSRIGDCAEAASGTIASARRPKRAAEQITVARRTPGRPVQPSNRTASLLLGLVGSPAPLVERWSIGRVQAQDTARMYRR